MKSLIGAAGEAVMGRRNLARLGQALVDRARLDVPNRIDSNGEALLQRAVLDNARDPVVVLDVGGHVGEWTKQLIALHRRETGQRLQVHVFEPAATTHRLLSRNLVSLRTAAEIELCNLALSDREGEAQLFTTGVAAGTNSLHRGFEPPEDDETVGVTTVDAYAKSTGIKHIALLKIDAEGHDYYVIRGASQLLEDRRIAVVQFEYNHRWINGGAYLRDAFELLQASGYELGKLTPRGVETFSRWTPALETYREGNYLGFHPDCSTWFVTFRWWGD